MTEYDLRQLDRMLEAMNSFDNRQLHLGELISALDGLLNALEDLDEHWKDEFRKKWGVLEDVYADELDRGLKDIPSEHMALLNGAISNIRELISQARRQLHP